MRNTQSELFVVCLLASAFYVLYLKNGNHPGKVKAVIKFTIIGFAVSYILGGLLEIILYTYIIPTGPM